MDRKLLLIIVVVLVILFIWWISGCRENFENEESKHKVPLTNFINGLSKAITLNDLPSICKLGGTATLTAVPPKKIAVPEEFDLRKYNFLTPVMNQEMCGGCWAFAVVGCLSDRINFWKWDNAGRPGFDNKSKEWKSEWKDLVLSPQYLLSCDADESAQGCEGSSDILEAVKACTQGEKDMLYDLPNGTLMYSDHPFDVCQHENGSGVVNQQQSRFGPGLKCGGDSVARCDRDHMQKHFNSDSPKFFFKSYYSLSTGNFEVDIEKLKEDIYLNGPVILGISVFSNMYDRSGNIARGAIQTASGSYMGGHAVLCCGWGKDYLIIKNSWGPKWGMDGYWYQSIKDKTTLRFGGPGINMTAGIPIIPSSLKAIDIQIPVVPE